ncbi:alpha-L-fucosidase [Hymenobacter sp. GOD-10R]|uniref:alpha-L-fucosidase n=1 Tax=Hymenobacter sp. GOD-10R TaxID=3093922 RepID=UPI002D7961C2|nr:alpha-L-fucosidase [Hymenobacter sp. GOD-10R]WRQ27878.1 alpha-L-fucosidase [Hymenobacter sp. GOD-10R]
MVFARYRSRLLLLAGLVVGLRAQAQPSYEPTWSSLDQRPIPQWFTDAKFGIFIHWGVYSVPAYRPVSPKMYETYAEWYGADVYGNPTLRQSFHNKNYGPTFTYRDFGPLFRAELFDPVRWADLFARAGARYVVLTAKHHDGYSLWPTTAPYKQQWNSGAVGPKRDLVGDLAQAVRARGLKMGLYYSLLEWESTPTQSRPSGYYLPPANINQYRIPDAVYVEQNSLWQLKELVTRYQPALLFADGEWDRPATYWKSTEFLAWLYNHAPNREEVVVNDRWGQGTRGQHGGYYTSEYASDNDKVGAHHPWEESRGMGQSYGFNRAENLEDYSSSAQLVHQLIDIVSRGGNLLLNIGPAADGTIPVLMQERLVDIGKWLAINGEAIYGTKVWRANAEPSQQTKTLYYTTKGRDLYVLATSWPTAPFVVTGLPATSNLRVTLLGSQVPVKYRRHKGQLILQPPPLTPAQIPSPLAYVFKIQNATP